MVETKDCEIDPVAIRLRIRTKPWVTKGINGKGPGREWDFSMAGAYPKGPSYESPEKGLQVLDCFDIRNA